MGRVGKGPLKGRKNNYRPADATIVLLVCIPHFEGYYKQRFAILKYCLASILKNSGDNCDLLVVDNKSHAEVRYFLQALNEKGYIDYLILNSINIGLSGALNIAYNAAPGKYIAFTNDDIFFHSGWLNKHIEICETFPEVGLVCGQTIVGPDRQDSVKKLAEKYEDISCKEFEIPIEWVEQFTKSIGRDTHVWLSTKWGRNNKHTYLIEKNGLKAFSGKTGYSYLFRKELLNHAKVFPFKTGMMAGDSTDREFALSIAEAGYLWLTTYEKTTEHMGNYLEPEWYEKFEKYHVTDFLKKLEESIQA